MRKPTLAIVVAMAVAMAATPVRAGEFIVENDLGATLYVGCGTQHSVAAGSESDAIDCSEGIDIRLEPGGDPGIHSHDCSDPTPVHRIRVTDSTAAVALDGQRGMAFSHSCESAE